MLIYPNCCKINSEGCQWIAIKQLAREKESSEMYEGGGGERKKYGRGKMPNWKNMMVVKTTKNEQQQQKGLN